MSKDNLRALRDAQAAPAHQRVYQSASVNRFADRDFGALEPGTLLGILKQLRLGDFEDFADLWSFILRTDPTVRSLVITRQNAVAGADIEVLPGPFREGEEALAEEAASFVREAQERVEEWEDRFTDLLGGTFIGPAVLENRWLPERDTVWGDFLPVLSRDLRYRGDWDLQVRTYAGTGAYQWVSLRDPSLPSKFVVSVPHNISERPTHVGEAHAILYPWLFKRWIEKFGLEGFGKLANGFMYSVVSGDTDGSKVTSRHSELETLSTDGVAVFVQSPGEARAPIELLEASRDPGATQETLLTYYNGELAKAILGSGLNVEVGSTGGNRALGESQFATTILPRLQADAKRALGALRRDWVKPLLSYNRHKFGGRMPPVPYLVAKLVAEEQQPIDPQAVQAGAVTVDELRSASGLDPWGPEKGGDRVVSPLAKVQPGFSSVASGGAPPPAPFRRTPPKKPHQLKLPLTSTQTHSASPSPFSLALSRRSDDPER